MSCLRNHPPTFYYGDFKLSGKKTIFIFYALRSDPSPTNMSCGIIICNHSRSPVNVSAPDYRKGDSCPSGFIYFETLKFFSKSSMSPS